MLREVLAVQKRVQGAEHPDTLTTANDLATSLSRQGKYAEAEEMLREVAADHHRIDSSGSAGNITCQRTMGRCQDEGSMTEWVRQVCLQSRLLITVE